MDYKTQKRNQMRRYRWRLKNPDHPHLYWIEDHQLEGEPNCIGCGKPMEGKRQNAKYCSNACKQRSYRKRL